MNNLARAYSDMGKRQQAVRLQEQVVTMLKYKKGKKRTPSQ